MSILGKLMGTAQNTAARGTRAGRTTARGPAGRSMGTGRRAMPRGGRAGRGAPAPAAGGGLGRLLGSLTGRR
jgi:hypothetical protein